MSNFFKYLTDIKTHFTIKNRFAKNKVMSLLLLDQFFFFKSIIGLIQILGGPTLIFEN